jgi:hypothetical protein
VPELAGDAAVGLTFAAAFNCKDDRPVAQAFVKLVNEKYKVRCPDHDFSQAYETAQLIKLALTNAKLTLTDASLKADRAAIRDALANIKNFTGLASGPINFCAEPTPHAATGIGPASLWSIPRAARTSTRASWRACRSIRTSASEPASLNTRRSSLTR